jgi:hypothetical protein
MSEAAAAGGAPPALPPTLDWSRQDLARAVGVVLERDGHLFSAGELVVLRAFLALPEQPASVYARLFGRVPRVFRVSELAYAEVPELPVAADRLLVEGFAWAAHRMAPLRLLLAAYRADELKVACRALGRPTGGKRADLEARLQDEPARAAFAEPSLLIGHRGLFRRVTRLYLHDHQGDLSKLVVARLEFVRYPVYEPTGGAGLFPDRRELLAYEGGLARRWSLEGEALLAEVPAALDRVRVSPPPPAFRARFSGRRFDEELLLAAAAQREREKDWPAAALLYAGLIEAGSRYAAEAGWRLAMVEGHRGDPAAGVARCLVARAAAGPGLRAAADRTGRRLARAASLSWTPLPALRAPPERRVTLEAASSLGHRPGWATGGGVAPVEAAVVARLAAAGRRAVHAENELWHSLVGLLFREALFAPVSGMLPTALLHAPLDYGTPLFYAQRRGQIELILTELREGGGPERLRSVARRHAGEAIQGVRWDLFGDEPGEGLAVVVAQIGGPALEALLRPLVEDLRSARRGMPDLCLLPGPALHLPGGDRPVPETLLLAEIKGPGDSLRDDQRVWFDRLLTAGVPAELWLVEQARPARDSGGERVSSARTLLES